MNPFYNLGIHLFSASVALASLRNNKARRLREGQRTALAKIASAVADVNARRAKGGWVWFHAASLGEFEQGRPLIERLHKHHPDAKILLTFFSPSGYEVRKDYRGADVVAFLPLDTEANAAQFLDIVRPAKAVFIKYEFWGNYLEQLAARSVPTYLVSAIFRPKQIFFRPWGGMFRKMLKRFTGIYIQDENSQKLLKSIGIDATVAGDTRFDRVKDIMAQAAHFPALEQWTKEAENVLVAGSTWPVDEETLFPWLADHPQVRAIIAPHEFDAERLSDMKAKLGAKSTAFLSEIAQTVPDGVTHIIVDSIGYLSSLYRHATLAYVGGGFGEGIHNINEAAVYGVPVVFGPRHRRFKEARDMAKLGGGFAVGSAEALRNMLSRLSADSHLRTVSGKIAGDYIARSVGASDRIFPELFPYNTPI
ncbi:MAG: 3-deoxy-D-manno-octulosonic acid transferase [Muribaculaceae bacterium]|nr:3-deoxy-D-manno-octulosonic acid transferase [Muribaculaceae bacterium]